MRNNQGVIRVNDATVIQKLQPSLVIQCLMGPHIWDYKLIYAFSYRSFWGEEEGSLSPLPITITSSRFSHTIYQYFRKVPLGTSCSLQDFCRSMGGQIV